MSEQILTKKETRARVREMRKQLPEEALLSESRRIFGKVRASQEYKAAGTVFVYMSMAGEVQTREFIEQAWADGKKVAVPKTDLSSHQIRFCYIENFEQVRPGVMGILEPVTCPCADGDGDALIIMPGVAFDPGRHRVGYGGGFYDRYLEAHPGHPTAAVAFDFQIFDKVPAEVHDLQPDRIYTPTQIL